MLSVSLCDYLENRSQIPPKLPKRVANNQENFYADPPDVNKIDLAPIQVMAGRENRCKDNRPLFFPKLPLPHSPAALLSSITLMHMGFDSVCNDRIIL